jgi:hypothetical protein
MTTSASPSPTPAAAPVELPKYLYDGALFLSERLGVDRLLVVSSDGAPLATFVRTREGARFETPQRRYGEASANVALLRFARMHLSRERLGIRRRLGAAR